MSDEATPMTIEEETTMTIPEKLVQAAADAIARYEGWSVEAAIGPARMALEAVVKHHACSDSSQAFSCGHSTCILAALSCSGFAVVRLPEGVEVEHGARLKETYVGTRRGFFVFEATPEQLAEEDEEYAKWDEDTP